MLTDEEIISIRNKCSSDRSTIDTIEYAKAIERAVLAKAMPKQEPVTSRRKDFMGNYVYRNEIILGNEPLYAYPQPAQAAAIPEDIAKKIWSHGYSRGHNDGIGCGHDLAPRCRHDGDDEAVDFLDDVISMLSASPKPDKS